MAIFTDPDCPFCKRLESEMKGLDNVTVYTFLFPLDQLRGTLVGLIMAPATKIARTVSEPGAMIARVDEVSRGEGKWLQDADGRRYRAQRSHFFDRGFARHFLKPIDIDCRWAKTRSRRSCSARVPTQPTM